jgi:hypothetical protein
MTNPNPQLRSNLSPLYDSVYPVLDTIFHDNYNRHPEVYSNFLNVKTMDKQSVFSYEMSSFGLVPENNENEDPSWDELIGGNRKQFSYTKYGAGNTFTEEALSDEQYGQLKKIPAMWADSMRETVEIIAARIFNYPTATTYHSGFDSLALLSASHTLLGGGTASNILGTPADLDETSLREAIILMEDCVDNRGKLLNLKARTLVVAPEGRWTARELLESAGRPGTADNDTNAMKGEDLQYKVHRYMTDADSWFLLADKHDLNFWWRKRPYTKMVYDDYKELTSWIVRAKFVAGFADWRGVVGTQGAG